MIEKTRISTYKLDPEFIKTLADFVEFFKTLKIRYWLGGGIYKCLYQKKYGCIKRLWREKYTKKKKFSKHDIDIYVLVKDKKLINKNANLLKPKGYRILCKAQRKTAFYSLTRNRIEITYLFQSAFDRRLFYFLSRGKKGAPHMQDQDIRRRMYVNDIPKEFFHNDYFILDRLKVRVPIHNYIEFIYHFRLVK